VSVRVLVEHDREQQVEVLAVLLRPHGGHPGVLGPWVVDTRVRVAREDTVVHLLLIDPVVEILDVLVEKLSLNEIAILWLGSRVDDTLIVALTVASRKAIVIALLVEDRQVIILKVVTLAVGEVPVPLVGELAAALVVERAVPGEGVKINDLIDADAKVATLNPLEELVWFVGNHRELHREETIFDFVGLLAEARLQVQDDIF